MSENTKSFTSIMKDVFQLPGQGLMEFAKELRALSFEDKKWFADALINEGYKFTYPTL